MAVSMMGEMAVIGMAMAVIGTIQLVYQVCLRDDKSRHDSMSITFHAIGGFRCHSASRPKEPFHTNSAADSQRPKSGTALLVPRRGQCRRCPLNIDILDQHVVRIKRGNREDRNPRLRQWIKERRQHPGHRKRKRPFQLECHPPTLDQQSLAVLRNAILPAHHRQLIPSSRHAVKLVLNSPRRDLDVRCSPANRQPLTQNLVFQFVWQSEGNVTRCLVLPAR